jgi:DNA sulfur modification protein DndC
MRDEYLQPRTSPWAIGFSGGKDSTLVTHLALQMLLDLPPDQRTRPVHIVANDTLVESPLVIHHLYKTTEQIAAAARRLQLPVTVKITSPEHTQTFWANLSAEQIVLRSSPP